MPNVPLLSTKHGNSSLELGKKMGFGFFCFNCGFDLVGTLEKTAQMCSCRGVTFETVGWKRMHCLPTDQKTYCRRWMYQQVHPQHSSCTMAKDKGGFAVGRAGGLRCFCPVWLPAFLSDRVHHCWQKWLRKMTKDCISNVCMINWLPPPLIACEC